jgi:hypothetical protein
VSKSTEAEERRTHSLGVNSVMRMYKGGHDAALVSKLILIAVPHL